MIPALVTLLMASATILYLVAPFTRGAEPETPPDETPTDPLNERQEATYAALRDLADEYALGKLSADDYFPLRDRYARRAMLLLKAIDQRDHDGRAAVEEAVRSLRAARMSSAPATQDLCPICRQQSAAAGALCGTCAAAAARTLHAEHGVAALSRSHRWLLATTAAVALFGLLSVGGLLLLRQHATVVPVSVLPVPDVRALAFSPTTAGTLLAASPSGLLTSADGGVAWTPLRAARGMATVAAAGVPGSTSSRLWTARQDLVLTSTNDGQRWRPLARPTAGVAVRALTVESGDPTQLFAALANGTIAESHDGGASWKLTSTAASGSTAAPADVSALALVPGAPTLLFAASTTAGIVVSGDHGAHWSEANGFVNGLLPTRSVRALAYDPASGDRFVEPDGTVVHGALYAGTALGLFKSIDRGASWAPLALHRSIAAIAIDPLDPRHIAAVDVQGQLYVTHDRGVRWSK